MYVLAELSDKKPYLLFYLKQQVVSHSNECAITLHDVLQVSLCAEPRGIEATTYLPFLLGPFDYFSIG